MTTLEQLSPMELRATRNEIGAAIARAQKNASEARKNGDHSAMDHFNRLADGYRKSLPLIDTLIDQKLELLLNIRKGGEQ